MNFIIAFKAFFAALKQPDKVTKFLQELKQKKLLTSTAKEPENDMAHLRLLSILQQSSRLIDFFKEDLSACSDAQIGIAVRKIHEDCRKKLEELVTIRPIFEQEEGTHVQIAAGYDPSSIKIVGKVIGQAPYHGILIHKGWKAHKRSLPKLNEPVGDTLCPAEIEVKGK